MKKFLLLFVVWGIGLCVLAFVAETMITSKLRKSPERMYAPWNEIYSGNLHYDGIIMGSSRAWRHYDPAILESILKMNFYNMGIDGSQINRQVIKYNTFCRLNAKPKVIIHNIDLWLASLSYGYEREQFFPYFSDKTFLKEISCEEPFNWLEKYLPAYRYMGYPKQVTAGLGMTLFSDEVRLTKGYYGREELWDGTELRKLDGIDFHQDSIALRMFDRYLSEVKKDNIKLIFVYAPIYIEATKKIRNVEKMYQMFDNIARKYDIPLLDYSYAPMSYDTTYFYDANHLNKKGAEFFSAKLAHDIDSLGILNKVMREK